MRFETQDDQFPFRLLPYIIGNHQIDLEFKIGSHGTLEALHAWQHALLYSPLGMSGCYVRKITLRSDTSCLWKCEQLNDALVRSAPLSLAFVGALKDCSLEGFQNMIGCLDLAKPLDAYILAVDECCGSEVRSLEPFLKMLNERNDLMTDVKIDFQSRVTEKTIEYVHTINQNDQTGVRVVLQHY